MDYWDKIKKILFVQDLGKRRIEQLDKEEIHDKKLQETYKSCPDLVFAFMMQSREYNRRFFRQAYTMPAIEYPQKLLESMDRADKIYSENISCHSLARMINDYQISKT